MRVNQRCEATQDRSAEAGKSSIKHHERLELAFLCSRFFSTMPSSSKSWSGTVMNRNDFKSMSTEELWALHEEIAEKLAKAMKAEKSVLENRLKLLRKGIEIFPATRGARSPGAKPSTAKPSTARPSAGKASSAKSLSVKSSRARTSGGKPSTGKSPVGKSPGGKSSKSSIARRPYPAVLPKYRNPERPSETWAGRGKTPRWLTAQLESGRQIDDFRIRNAA